MPTLKLGHLDRDLHLSNFNYHKKNYYRISINNFILEWCFLNCLKMYRTCYVLCVDNLRKTWLSHTMLSLWPKKK